MSAPSAVPHLQFVKIQVSIQAHLVQIGSMRERLADCIKIVRNHTAMVFTRPLHKIWARIV